MIDAMNESPISGAAVRDGRGELLVKTEARGIASLVRGTGGPGWLEVRVEAAGYAAATEVVEWEGPGVIVRMQKPVSIRGRIESEFGEQLSQRIDVLAWPFGEGAPTIPEAFAAIRDDSGGASARIKHARMATDGTFQIDGVTPSTVYTLLAGGGGLVTRQYSSVTPKRQELVVLEVTKTYGILARLVDRDGARISPHDPRLARRTISRGCDSPVADPMDVSDLGALLAGLPPRYLIDESDSGILSLYYSTSDVSTIDECWVAFDCPGFSNAHLDGVARAMDSGLSEYEIVVVQQVSGFGSVFLAPVGCAKGMAERIGHAFVTLALSNVENQEKDSLGGYMSLLEGCVVHEVPVGTYEWTVVGREGLWRLRDNSIKSDLVVAEGVTTRLDLDLHQVGAIIVHPVLPNGDTYSGSLAMGIGPGLPTVGPDGKRRMSNGYVYSQARGPYVLPLLDPGEYTLKGMGPKWGLPSDGGWLTVKVESGVDLEVEVQVEDQ